MGGTFMGGAVGSWFSGIAWRAHGWEAVAGLGAVLVLLGLGIHGIGRVVDAKRRNAGGRLGDTESS